MFCNGDGAINVIEKNEGFTVILKFIFDHLKSKTHHLNIFNNPYFVLKTPLPKSSNFL